MEANRILLGNCQKVLGDVPDNSVDLLPTDPPYGYSFMGKDWDKAVPRVAIWKECLRVLKPGAFAFVMSSPRADVLSHMIVNLSDAGFRTDFTPIYWAYASGFPKAMNIGKAVDKRFGLKREVIGKKPAFPDGTRGASNVSASQGVPVDYGKFGAFAENGLVDVTVPASEEAKVLEGSFAGFQPKPAVEVIIVAMKPLSEKTFVDQALKNQKGITWLDEGRIPFQSDADKEQAHTNALGPVERSVTSKPIYEGGKQNGGFADTFDEKGRFPANLLVSDDALNDGQQWEGKDGFKKTACSIYGNEMSAYAYNGDSKASYGSFSRYFNLDAWFEKRVKFLPLEVQRTYPFLIVPKASKDERNKNLEKLVDAEKYSDFGLAVRMEKGQQTNIRTNVEAKKTKNIHPTVKPLQLMSYLITLGSRPNDLVLDPFCGSGTTCLAAKMLGRRFLGVELNKEYHALAETRVGNHRTLFEFAPPQATEISY